LGRLYPFVSPFKQLLSVFGHRFTAPFYRLAGKKQQDIFYQKAEVSFNRFLPSIILGAGRFLHCAMLRIASVEMTRVAALRFEGTRFFVDGGWGLSYIAAFEGWVGKDKGADV
jgi:hypothetical protein